MRLGRVVASILLLMATLIGCASGPTFAEIEMQLPALRADSGRIYIFRDGWIGLAVQPDIRINDEVVGTAKPDGFFFVDRPAGTYTVAVKTEAESKLVLSVAAGETKYVRLDVGIGVVVARFTPELVDEAEGCDAIRELHYTGGTVSQSNALP